MFNYLNSQRWLGVPATTLIAFSICAISHTEAQANSLSTDALQVASPDAVSPLSGVNLPQTAPDSTANGEIASTSDADQQWQLGLEYKVSLTEEHPFDAKADIDTGAVGTVALPALDALSSSNPISDATAFDATAFTPTAFDATASDSTISFSVVPVASAIQAPTLVTQSSAESSQSSSAETPPSEPMLSQTSTVESPEPLSEVSRSSQDLGNPLVQVQGVYTLQGDESSVRGRVSASYAITPNLMVGGTVDLTSGNAFSDSPEEGIDLNELYVAVSPTELPNLRFVAGMLDLTSYFDRNSFAKDAATHFLNPVFQSNPALAAAGLGSRPAILLNWSVADPVEIKVAGFSSSRDLGELALDGFAGEIGLRFDNLIVRGTYITGRDAGQDDGFREIFGLQRGSEFGLDSDDREAAYGINAEYFIPEINLGLFARYGWYENLDLDQGGSTFSLGFNLLDLFMPDDRLGLAYGRELSNDDLRQDQDDDYPDVWEFFYDFRITPNLRAGVTLQSREQFSETIGGFRIRADFDSSDFGRLFR